MSRAIQLAKLGKGNVSPNPLVGCVIVFNGKIIGEGWHQKYGEAHAEVNAVKSVKDKSLLKECIVYVTLEPCSHFGKTPPCADLLIKESVREVVIANRDPHPKVSGNGIKKLKEAGIRVTEGVLAKEAFFLNRRFLVTQEMKRPYIILKWAQTQDGYIARSDYSSKWISNQHSRKLVHKWRGEEDAILAGTNTIRVDNPSLNVRDWEGSNPLRIVLDKELVLDKNLSVFDKSIPTIVFNTKLNQESENLVLIKINKDKDFIESALNYLYTQNVTSVLVEGGAATHKLFIENNLWDEARIFVSNNEFGEGIQAANIGIQEFKESKIFGDTLKIYLNHGGRISS